MLQWCKPSPLHIDKFNQQVCVNLCHNWENTVYVPQNPDSLDPPACRNLLYWQGLRLHRDSQALATVLLPSYLGLLAFDPGY